jgi:lipopolysaccharide export system permease protein
VKLLERRVMRTFLVTLVGALAAIVVIFIVLDLTENMSTFIDRKAPLAAVALNYLYYIPEIVVLTLPVAMLLASLATLGGMARDNELIALKASGVSSYLPIRALAALALVVTIGSFFIGETLAPAANSSRGMLENEFIKRQGVISRNETINRAFDLGQGRVLFVKRYNSEERQGLDCTLAFASGIRVDRLVQAQRMRWGGEGDRWTFETVIERTWTDGVESYRRYPRLEEALPFVTPEILAARQKEPEEMGYSELRAYVERGRVQGRPVIRAQVDMYTKLAFPFSNFIIVLFGAALAAVRRRSGLAVGFTLSLFICFVYYIVMRTGQALGYNGDLSPWLAAWIGNFLFGGLSLYFLRRARY